MRASSLQGAAVAEGSKVAQHGRVGVQIRVHDLEARIHPGHVRETLQSQVGQKSHYGAAASFQWKTGFGLRTREMHEVGRLETQSAGFVGPSTGKGVVSLHQSVWRLVEWVWWK